MITINKFKIKKNIFIISIISIFLFLFSLFIIYIFQKNYFSSEINKIDDKSTKNIELYIEIMEKRRTIVPTIPLQIFQTWKTSELPPYMKKCVDKLKKDNPEFKHYLFNDEECYDYIKNAYDSDVVNAFDTFIPGAFKADLFRYCILYKEGGIYIDIKFNTINQFKLIDFVDKEYFVKDLDRSGEGIYNAFMVCKAGNPILKKCIDKIVENVKNRYYGPSVFSVTGPTLMKQFFSKDQMNAFEIYISNRNEICDSDVCLYYKNKPFLSIYNEYRDEQDRKKNKEQGYFELWKERNIYK
jgi:mannosyltransferase OCH1-like enzyme